jgi:bifunctional DNase/RNase
MPGQVLGARSRSPSTGRGEEDRLTYQFVAALVQALGGRVRQVQIDRVVEDAYAATVEVEGPPGMQSVDARPSDALNLAPLVQAPIFAAPGVLRRYEWVIPPRRRACVGHWRLHR